MLEGLVAPLRVVLQRSFADWLIVAATWLVIACATTLVAIGVLYGDAVSLTGLRRIIADQPATATTVMVEMRASAEELVDVEPKIERQVGRILAWTGGELATVVRSESYAVPDQPSGERTSLVVFGAYEAIDRHADLREGSWPETGAEPMQVAVSANAARALGWAVGDEVPLTSRRGGDRELAIEVVGVWEPREPADPYWRGDRLELDGASESSSFVTHGPLVVARDDLLARAASGDVAYELRALPAFARLDVDDANWMRSDTAALERRLRDALGSRAFFQVETELDAILASANRSLLVSRSGVVVLTIQFAVLAGYALLLVAGLLVEQRQVDTALLRSRGAGLRHLAVMSLLEGLILVVPAVLAAPWLAASGLELLNVAGPLADAGIRIEPRVDATVTLAAAGVGLAAVVGVMLPALGAGRGLAAVRQAVARQGNRTLAQRLGIDLVLVILAGIGLWQLRQYGAPLIESVRGSVGLDPLLVAAPAIGLLAGSIVALRLVPLAAQAGERLLVGGRGLVAPLGARQLARRPLRYTRSALLLMLAASLATFAGAYASTWTTSQADQAAYRAASDVRLEISDFPDLAAWVAGPAYRAIEGVEEALPVARDRFDVDATGGGTILALDATAAPGVVYARDDFAEAPLDELLGRLADRRQLPRGVALSDGTTAFALQLTAEIEPLVSEDGAAASFSPGFRGIIPTVVVRDADGLVHHVPGTRLGLGLGSQAVDVSLATELSDGTRLMPAAPLELLGIELLVEIPEEALGVGTITLDSLEAVGPRGRTAVELGDLEPYEATAREPLPGFGPADPTEVDFALSAGAPGPVPVLASESYLRSTGAATGETVELGGLGGRRPFEIVGALRAFPTLDPAQPFVIADLATLAATEEAADPRLEADEWWLRTADGASTAVAEALRADPYSAQTATVRDELHAALLTDPVALGLIGALVIGALSAVVFAAIGFVVSATVSARERLGEFALLQAIGLSHRQLSAWITIESAFLLVVGLLSGTGLGLLLAWVVLPFVTLTQEATVVVPPVQVVLPWSAYAVLYLGALGALLVTVLVVGRLLARVRVSGVLRAGGD